MQITLTEIEVLQIMRERIERPVDKMFGSIKATTNYLNAANNDDAVTSVALLESNQHFKKFKSQIAETRKYLDAIEAVMETLSEQASYEREKHPKESSK